ncbi:MAG: hypothetical protein ACT4OK_02610 [Gemmobacter sp.]
MTHDPARSEAELIAELVRINLDYVPRAQCPAMRSEHGKGIADLAATFTVIDHIGAGLGLGLFAAPASYAATVRFSNGAVSRDSKRDTHGLAIKVHGVPMQTAPVGPDGQRFQDFILLDSPVFIMGNLAQYVPFNRAFLASKLTLGGKLGMLRQMIAHPRAGYFVLRLALNRANAPLSTNYWSTTPYRLGPRVVKYLVRAAPRDAPAPRIHGTDGRRAALQEQLRAEPGRFTFGVLVQTDPVRQPVEDPTVNWERNGAEFVPLAELLIPSDQPVDAPATEENALTFSPGHAAAEHFPLGAINRARVAIYAAASRARQAAHDTDG